MLLQTCVEISQIALSSTLFIFLDKIFPNAVLHLLLHSLLSFSVLSNVVLNVFTAFVYHHRACLRWRGKGFILWNTMNKVGGFNWMTSYCFTLLIYYLPGSLCYCKKQCARISNEWVSLVLSTCVAYWQWIPCLFKQTTYHIRANSIIMHFLLNSSMKGFFNFSLLSAYPLHSMESINVSLSLSIRRLWRLWASMGNRRPKQAFLETTLQSGSPYFPASASLAEPKQWSSYLPSASGYANKLSCTT